MYVIPDRRLIITVLMALIGLALVGGVVSATAEAGSTLQPDWDKLDSIEAETVYLIHPGDEELGDANTYWPDDPAGPSAPAAPVLITEEDFEEEEFPPPGWTVQDEAARLDQVENRYTFSREICNTMTIIGGMAAAWAVGGGSEGEQLPCWTPYSAGTDIHSLLLYTVDTRIYAAGLQVGMHMNLKVPEGAPPETFQVCVTTGDDAQPFQCYNISSGSPGQWGTLRPMTFDMAANQETAILFVRYQDPGGSLQTEGVLIDNVKVWGLPEPVEPTATEPIVTDTPVTPPTQQPPTPTNTPPVVKHAVYMPMAVKGFDVEDVPEAPTVSPTGVEVQFGTEVSAANGEITGQGSQFQYGVMQLCARERWWGQEPGTQLRYQWYYYQDAIEQLAGEMSLDSSDGFDYQCTVGPVDEQGRPQPVPHGAYSVEVFLGDDELPTVVGNARIDDEVPPGKTPLP